MTHCLIVDASGEDRRTAAKLLRRYDFDIDESTDAESALALCRRTMPDVILLADQPGGLDGVEFLRRLRRWSTRIKPVVLMCAREADPGSLGRAIWAGAAECLMKPFDAEILDFKLRQWGLI
jgi:two-component system chemotaxis response regulator CheY